MNSELDTEALSAALEPFLDCLTSESSVCLAMGLRRFRVLSLPEVESDDPGMDHRIAEHVADLLRGLGWAVDVQTQVVSSKRMTGLSYVDGDRARPQLNHVFGPDQSTEKWILQVFRSSQGGESLESRLEESVEALALDVLRHASQVALRPPDVERDLELRVLDLNKFAPLGRTIQIDSAILMERLRMRVRGCIGSLMSRHPSVAYRIQNQHVEFAIFPKGTSVQDRALLRRHRWRGTDSLQRSGRVRASRVVPRSGRINRSESLPDLTSDWQTAVNLEARTYVKELLQEIRRWRHMGVSGVDLQLPARGDELLPDGPQQRSYLISLHQGIRDELQQSGYHVRLQTEAVIDSGTIFSPIDLKWGLRSEQRPFDTGRTVTTARFSLSTHDPDCSLLGDAEEHIVDSVQDWLESDFSADSYSRSRRFSVAIQLSEQFHGLPVTLHRGHSLDALEDAVDSVCKSRDDTTYRVDEEGLEVLQFFDGVSELDYRYLIADDWLGAEGLRDSGDAGSEALVARIDSYTDELVETVGLAFADESVTTLQVAYENPRPEYIDQRIESFGERVDIDRPLVEDSALGQLSAALEDKMALRFADTKLMWRTVNNRIQVGAWEGTCDHNWLRLLKVAGYRNVEAALGFSEL